MNKSVAVKSIEFSRFRNYSKLELGELARLVIIVGDNALGKTNIIEGIQLLSTMDSFRKPAWRDVVQKGEEQAHISLVYEANGCENNTSLEIKDNKRFYQYNEKPKKTRDLLGLLPAVLFTPSDLQIIQGPAEFRRLCIDNLGCQLSRTFVDIKQEYTRVVKQKNALLRDGYTDQHILASWNRNLAKLGSSLLEHRRSLFEKMREKAAEVYHQIAPKESFSAEYVPSWQLLDEKNERPESYSSSEGALPEVELGAEDKAPQPAFFEENGEKRAEQTLQDNRQTNNQTSEEHFVSLLEKHHFAEARSRRALIGPHRDEIRFFIDGNDARRFGSQGQQRSLALALKIAEVEILRELTGTDPLLLLDDVMSELDEKRRRLLLELIGTGTQTFITTTNLSYFDEKVLKEAQIIQLPLDGSGGALKETVPAPKKTTRKKPAAKTTATKRTAAKKPATKPAVKTKSQASTKTKAAPHV